MHHRHAPSFAVPARLAAAALLAAAAGLAFAGCGEAPEPGASRDAMPGADGGSRSTLGRARDRAESVIEDMKAADQERMDLIDEMNGVERQPDPPADDADDADR